MTAPSSPAEQPPDRRIRKPRRAEVWAIVVSVLIVLGLLGHLLNQQRSKPSGNSESLQRESAPAPAAPETKTEAAQQRAPRQNAGNSADPRKPSQVVYAVTHKHRLRDCHGTLTFTREGLRFESDEPQDSFAVRRNDVTIEGDVLRIRDKMWRFEFEDSTRAERIFQDWKSGTLRIVPPSPVKK